MTTLPAEIIFLIFKKLDIKSLLRCALVCKQWHDLFNSNDLWRFLCGAHGSATVNSIDWKQHYQKMIAKKYITSWENIPFALALCFIKPQMKSVSICNKKIYFGSMSQNEELNHVEGLYCLDSVSNINNEKPFTQIQPQAWEYGSVNCIDRFQDRFLACGCNSISNNIVILDTHKDEIVQTFTHFTNELTDINTTWQNKKVSVLKWADDGKRLFSGSPCQGDGVCLWNVETGQKINSFNHRRDNLQKEYGLYGLRDPHEIHGLCVTSDGNMFVSGSYRFLYQWDVRMANPFIQQIEFYPPPVLPDPVPRYFMNQESAYPLRHIGFSNPTQSVLTVFGQRIAKCVSYEFPSMVPCKQADEKFIDFEVGNIELEAVCFTPFYTFAPDIYGNTFVWSNYYRGAPTVFKPSDNDFYLGSGANGISLSEDGETVALSMSNPQSGWHGGIGCIYSISQEFSVSHKKKKKQKNCTTQ